MRVLLALVLAFFSTSAVLAAGVEKMSVTPSYTDEGDSVLPFAVTCATHQWTVVVASDTISRSVTMVSVSTNTPNVCVSTITTTGYTCSDTTPGAELTPGQGLTDYTKVQWNCRSKTTAYPGVLKGYRSRDTGDVGYIRRR